MKKVIIMGAGPAGLTVAYELLKKEKYEVKVIEKEKCVGGLAKSIIFNENTVDIGGHRFLTKNSYIQDLWDEILPIGEAGMHIRKRSSHILYNGKTIAYPIQINRELIKCVGIKNGMGLLTSYIYSMNHKVEEKNLEDFFVNRFGEKLYSLFFKAYTEKLWGVPAEALLPDWGAQCIQNLDLLSVIKYIINGNENRQKSMSDSFLYPIHGASQVWEEMYKKCIALGGKFSLESEVCQLFYDGKKIKAVEYKKNDNIRCEVADIVVSTIPLKELIEKIDSIPENIRKIGRSIKYRDMVTVSFTILKKYGGEKLIKNIKDNWIYLQEKSVRAGRLQILNNWSEASTNNEKFFLLQVEYYCDEDDEYWKLSDTRWAIMALEEMKKCSIISSEAAIEEYKVNRVSKAYPVYDENYKEIKKIWKTIDLINNIYCIGRNGRHIYGNMDQVMGSAVFASQVICAEGNGKDRLWYINQTDGYIEEK